MISLLKHIEDYREKLVDRPKAKSAGPPASPYRSLLYAIGESVPRAVPGVGSELERNLAELQQLMDGGERKESLEHASAHVRQELNRWADDALRQHNENERELREIIGVVSRAAEAVGQRDERYGKEIGGVAGKIRSIADQRDLAVVRRSILESATALNACVERMTEESRSSMRILATEVAEYRTRLEESEKAASVDVLTQLANRRGFERQMDVRMKLGKTFTLILLDLNRFKMVNDQYGHLAGDDLLRRFAVELKGQFTPADLVGRWGGDEFVALVAGDFKEAEVRAEAVRQWAFIEYKIHSGSNVVKVPVTASIGIAQWDGKESAQALMERADKAVYTGKEVARGQERREGVRRAEDRLPLTGNSRSGLVPSTYNAG